MAKKRCKKCGRQFDAKVPGEQFCSEICRMTGFFIGGGGDTAKPGAPKPAAVIPQPKMARVKKDDERFVRVRLMFTKPPKERWGIAKDFTEEERAYARRLARREMMEEERLSREWDWTSDTEEEPEGCGGDLGDSDDGSV